MAGKHEDAADRPAADQAQPDTAEARVGNAAGSDPGTLQTRLEEEKSRADKNLTNWQRAEADLANYKRRTEQERADLTKFANAGLIRKILPVLDDFERAIGTIPADTQSHGWVEGIKLIDKKLRTILEQEGVVTIDALGKEFDPHVHEAVMREEGEGEGDIDMVVQEFQKGYRLHDRVLRPAIVKVGRQKNDSSQTDHS
jgi:molecular chaperone GrpE